MAAIFLLPESGLEPAVFTYWGQFRRNFSWQVRSENNSGNSAPLYSSFLIFFARLSDCRVVLQISRARLTRLVADITRDTPDRLDTSRWSESR